MKALCVLILAGLLSACASQPINLSDASITPPVRLYAYQSPPDGPYGELTVVRDGGLAGRGCGIFVDIDGLQSAMLASGERAHFYIPTGRHVLGAEFSARVLCKAEHRNIAISVDPDGKTAYRIATGPGGTLSLVPITSR